MNLELLGGSWHLQPARNGRKYWVRRVVRDGKQCVILQHRVVMEMALQRSLLRSEHVHHRDGDGLNNEPSNLQVLTAGAHMRLHVKERVARREMSINRILDRFDWKRYGREILKVVA